MNLTFKNTLVMLIFSLSSVSLQAKTLASPSKVCTLIENNLIRNANIIRHYSQIIHNLHMKRNHVIKVGNKKLLPGQLKNINLLIQRHQTRRKSLIRGRIAYKSF